MYSHHRHSHYHKMDNQDHAHVSLSYRFLSRGRRDSNRPPQRYCGNRLITSLNGVCAGKGHQGMGCPDKADIRSIRQRRDEKRSVTDRCCKNACSYRQLKEMCCS
ncbi:hypothetical protein WR25_05046 [Diploscapter pachys]|uniref:Insulin-like domain-containing protein n=1 Tax=Diploscapter pachys TaxID=2018661 RepID=A0A2A2J4S1_9BILA|nr:hypothetical protein WR25_05046 [Diploscapter pachys]